MIEKTNGGTEKQQEAWRTEVGRLWPAIKGSLAQVRKPCIRKTCQACASGQKHPAWILAVVAEGRRSSLYVPEGLVGAIQQAIKNGRKLEVLLQKAAIQMVKSYRKTTKQAKKPRPKS